MKKRQTKFSFLLGKMFKDNVFNTTAKVVLVFLLTFIGNDFLYAQSPCLSGVPVLNRPCDDGACNSVDDIEFYQIDPAGGEIICRPCQGTFVLDPCNDPRVEKTVRPCNDGNACTWVDVETVIICTGEICVPCAGELRPDVPTCPVGQIIDESTCTCVLDAANFCNNTITLPCDDGDDCTIDDVRVVDANNQAVECMPCQGVVRPDDCSLPQRTVTLPCDDGNPCTMGDKITIIECTGTVCVPCAGELTNPDWCRPDCEVFNPVTCNCDPVPNTPCSDASSGPVDNATNTCKFNGVTVVPGEPCNDNDPCTYDDKITKDCECVGTKETKDSDNDGILDCEDGCAFQNEEMAYATLKCGETVHGNNALGMSMYEYYGDCSPKDCPSKGRELIYQFDLKSPTDLVITFKEDLSHHPHKKLNLFVVTDTCGPSQCIAAIHNPVPNGTDPERIMLPNAQPGPYFIIVDANGAYDQNKFSLRVDCLASGDNKCPDDHIYADDFEGQSLSSKISNDLLWSVVGNSSHSAVISNTRAANSEQSLEFSRNIGSGTDVDLHLKDRVFGAYKITWDMYIENMSSAHFGLFGGDNSDPWGSIGHTFRMGDAKYQNHWFDVELIVDLDRNKYTIYMANRHFVETGTWYLNLERLNLYTPPGGHFFIDNICYSAINGAEYHKVDNSNNADPLSKDVTLQDANGSLAKEGNTTTDISVKPATAISKDELAIYPNPTKGATTIDLHLAQSQNVQLQLFSQTGQLVRDVNLGEIQNVRQEIDLTGLSNGLYLVRITGEQSVLTKKVILQK